MSDVIDPGYYADQPVEPIDAIEQVCGCLDGYEGYLMGNVIKYVMRAGRKTDDPSEDLGKAANYAYRLVTGHWLCHTNAEELRDMLAGKPRYARGGTEYDGKTLYVPD